MPFLVLLVIFVVLVFLVRAGQRGGRTGLIARGLPARGLILSAARTATDATYGGQRFEVRSLVLDVEIPGRAPYEVTVSPMIPRICEALPGATLDLRVDPAKPDNLAIVGPAGASQWIGAATSIPGQTWAVKPGTSRSGCGTIALVLIGLCLSFGTVMSFVGGSREAPPPAPTPTHAPRPMPPTPTLPPRPTAAPVATSPHSTASPRHHPECEAAARCCAMLELVSCQALLSDTEAACAATLAEEKKEALKVGKRCP
jgi:hypothetical protein